MEIFNPPSSKRNSNNAEAAYPAGVRIRGAVLPGFREKVPLNFFLLYKLPTCYLKNHVAVRKKLVYIAIIFPYHWYV